MSALAESNTSDDETAGAVVSPALQIRAPTGKVSGPAVWSLLSSPSTCHVMGVMDSEAAASARPAGSTTATSRIAMNALARAVRQARGGLARRGLDSAAPTRRDRPKN